MAPERAQIHPYVAEDAKGAIEAVTGVAFGEQSDDIRVALVAQRRLQRLATALYLGSILLGEVEIFELGVQLDKEVPRIQRSKRSALFMTALWA